MPLAALRTEQVVPGFWAESKPGPTTTRMPRGANAPLQVWGPRSAPQRKACLALTPEKLL